MLCLQILAGSCLTVLLLLLKMLTLPLKLMAMVFERCKDLLE